MVIVLHMSGLCNTRSLERVQQEVCIPWSREEEWQAMDAIAEAHGEETHLATAAKEVWPSVQALLGLAIALSACTLLYSVLGSLIPCVSAHPIKFANAFVMLLVGACGLIAASVGVSCDTMEPSTYEHIVPAASVSRVLGEGYWACVVATVMAAARAVAFCRAN